MQKYTIWEEKVSSVRLAEDIVKELKIESNTARFLENKGIVTLAEVKEFLHTDYNYLLDPFLFSDMKKTLDRISQALKNNEIIYIYGDYDADGIMGTCILYKVLSSISEHVYTYLPNRFKEGYGLNIDIIDELKEKNVSLIITVDNGIAAIDEIEYARKCNIDVIITDHHECNEAVPNALAVLNPKKADEEYPYKNLCGAAVAFKLALAMIKQGFASYDIGELITLAMIGTIADIVPLIGENRSIVILGLNEMKKTKNPALIELMLDANIIPNEISCADIGFKIAPRINAAGRMTDANQTIQLFCNNDRKFVKDKVKILSEINSFRQNEDKKIFKQANEIVLKNDLQSKLVWVLSDSNWHEGVIGISAGKLVEEYNRPFILISEDENICKGSARSIPGFNIFEAIKNSAYLLERFGGHSAAAGFSIKKENIEQLERELNIYARENGIQKLLHVYRYYDLESHDSVFTEKFISEIELLSPFGYKNPKPLIRLNNCKIENIVKRGVEKNHVSCKVIKQDNAIKSIAFNQEKSFENIKENDVADLLIYPKINTFNNISKIEYEIRDIFFYNDRYDEYLKAAYKQFSLFYDKKEYLPAQSQLSELTLEQAISSSLPGDIIINYFYEAQKRAMRYLKYKRIEEEFIICYNKIENYEKDKKYILISPLDVPNSARIFVAEHNYFDAYEEDLYINSDNCIFLKDIMYKKKIQINREFLAYIYVRLSDIRALCENKLNNFINHLQRQNKYKVNYLLVRLALDIFDSLELVKYKYNEKTDNLFVEKIAGKEKKDINNSKIMIKLNNISN
jgi:single-stranded-DNA-specific exonuclease